MNYIVCVCVCMCVCVCVCVCVYRGIRSLLQANINPQDHNADVFDILKGMT